MELKRNFNIVRLSALLEGYEGWIGAGNFFRCKGGYYTDPLRDVVGVPTDTHTIRVYRKNRITWFEAPAAEMKYINSVIWKRGDLPAGIQWVKIHKGVPNG